MMNHKKSCILNIFLFLIFLCFSISCSDTGSKTAEISDIPDEFSENNDLIKSKLNQYDTIKLTADLTTLSANEKKMIPILIEASKIMDDLFWFEAFGNKDSLLNIIENDDMRNFTKINYGPWNRLNNNEPFVPGFGEKPEGANFYPRDITKEEFEKAVLPDKSSHYTLLRRDENNNLITIPYHLAFKDQVEKASSLLRQAAHLAEDPGLKKYLNLRADAFLNDEYMQSDLAWMDMKTNTIDIVIGPIENYEDKLYGYKTAHEAYVLIKNKSWSERLSKYAAFLPELQKNLPVPDQYKQEKPGTDSDLNAYDVIYNDCP